MSIIQTIIKSMGKKEENTPIEQTEQKQGGKNQTEKETIEEEKRDQETQSSKKAQIYNLIIVDESGSMSGLRQVTLSGINETMNAIREAQKEFAEKQEHFITLVTFDEHGADRPSVRTILDAVPALQVTDFQDYRPNGCTPLYDAMGKSLTSLRNKIGTNVDATGVVTVLTDGLENASREWRPNALRRLIDQLKEEGWTFSYMGSAHNVKEVSDLLSIDNVVEFSHDLAGAENTWARERSSKHAFYCKMANDFSIFDEPEEKRAKKKRFNKEYYSNRVTPERIETLAPNEVFVFGSNARGRHAGGAARIAVEHFGAQMGVGEGIQGQSYAIPTMVGMSLLQEAILRFCDYAREHTEQRFLVTPIGCGNAGYSPSEIAPLFKEAIELENVSLPIEFWDILGLRMFNGI